MPTHTVGQIKRFWQDQASTTERSAGEVTHRDVWQRWLEIETIKQFVRPTDRVLDIGCGNGFTTRRIAALVSDIVGMDYAKEMIDRAVKETGANESGSLTFKGKGIWALYDRVFRRSQLERGSLTFKVKDVLALSPEDFGLFDLVISERCLINLESWADQQRAISNIASVIKPGGRFIFIEGSKQGRANLNKLRQAVGLEAMPTVWHNIDFDEDETLTYLSNDFTVEEKLGFGVYDFVARVAYPLIVAPDEPQYDSRINEVAAKLALGTDEFVSLSRVLGLVLRKKSRDHRSRNVREGMMDPSSHGIPSNSYNPHCWIVGNPEIGEGTWIGAFTLIDGRGGLKIGKGCDISSGAHLLTHSSVRRCLSERHYDRVDEAETIIEDFVFVGENATILMGCRVGHHSVIAAGSVVKEHTVIPPYSLVAGVPARVVRSLRDEVNACKARQEETKPPIPLTRPCIGVEEQTAVAAVLASGWLTQGPKVAEFENAFKQYVGAQEAIAASSCTTALHLALKAVDVGPGDEVICPTLSFVATANAIVYCGATPVFVDVDPRTHNIDPGRVELALTPKTRVILAVHQLGLPADLGRLSEIANRHNLILIEDAACAAGAEYRGAKIGKPHGLMACFSFHPRKSITTGEGGMITTNDSALAERLRQLRQHGMSISDLDRHRGTAIQFESYPEIGFNYRMTDLQAAIGIEQLKKLPRIIERRRFLAQRYAEALAESRWIEPPFCPPEVLHPFQSYMVMLRPSASCTRDQLMERLLRDGIATRRGIMSIHREPPYRRLLGPVSFPEAERVSDDGLILPLYAEMSQEDQDCVIHALLSALEAHHGA